MLAEALIDIINNPNLDDKQSVEAIMERIGEGSSIEAEEVQWLCRPLMEAVKQGYTSVIQYLLERGANPNLVFEGTTPLHLAVISGSLGAVKVLVEAGADLLVRDIEGMTPYERSLFFAKNELISYFLDFPHAASAIVANYKGLECSPLDIVMQSSAILKLPAIMTLLEAGAGLVINRISSGVIAHLSVFKYSILPDSEFQIVGQYESRSGTVKKIVCTELNEFQLLLANPVYSFKCRQILNSLDHPLIQQINSPRLQRLKNYIASCLQAHLSDSPFCKGSHKNIEFLSIKELTNELNRQLLSSKASNDLMWNDFISDVPPTNFMISLTSQLQVISNILILVNSRKLKKPKIERNLLAFSCMTVSVILRIMKSAKCRVDIKPVDFYQQSLREIIHVYGDMLRERFTKVYNLIFDAHGTALLLLAQFYFDERSFDLARTLANESIYSNKKQIILANHAKTHNASLATRQQNIDHQYSQAFVILARIHMSEGRFNQALGLIENALNLAQPKIGTCRGISKAILLLCDKFPDLPNIKAVELLKKCIAKIEAVRTAQYISDNPFSKLMMEMISCEIIYLTELKQKLIDVSKLVPPKAVEPITLKLADTIKQLESLSIEGSTSSDNNTNLPKPIVLSKRTKRIKPTCSSNRDDRHVTQLDAPALEPYPAFAGSSSSSNISFAPRKQKVKTKGKSDPKLDTKKKKLALSSTSNISLNYGFTVPEGYIEPVVIEGGSLASNYLFMTMPRDHDDFAPFYKLIEGGYIHCIAQYGLNQQGLKLGKAEVQFHVGAPREQVAIARLKVCGNESRRAWGFIEQSTIVNGKARKLYVFKPENIYDKKDELRKGFRP